MRVLKIIGPAAVGKTTALNAAKRAFADQGRVAISLQDLGPRALDCTVDRYRSRDALFILDEAKPEQIRQLESMDHPGTALVASAA